MIQILPLPELVSGMKTVIEISMINHRTPNFIVCKYCGRPVNAGFEMSSGPDGTSSGLHLDCYCLTMHNKVFGGERKNFHLEADEILFMKFDMPAEKQAWYDRASIRAYRAEYVAYKARVSKNDRNFYCCCCSKEIQPGQAAFRWGKHQKYRVCPDCIARVDAENPSDLKPALPASQGQ